MLDALGRLRRKCRSKHRPLQQLEKHFEATLGYQPNLKNPQTYCEKIQWLKFNQQYKDKKVVARADKYAVRSFIANKGFADTLIDLYGVWNRPEDISWQTLPERFVLKLNNGSGSNYIRFVENREAFSKQQFETDIAKLKGSPCGWALGEFHYAAIPLKIMAEEYLINGDEPILDYKFYCFHGEVAFISAEQGKVKGRAFRDYYDLNWQRSHVDFFYDHPRPYKPFSKPKNFERMLKMARSLSEGYPHLRVDLYNLDGRIYFGELTYAPENGLTRWKPQSLDFEYGQRIDLDNINH